jgi:hypothetical protein
MMPPMDGGHGARAPLPTLRTFNIAADARSRTNKQASVSSGQSNMRAKASRLASTMLAGTLNPSRAPSFNMSMKPQREKIS